MSSEDGSPPGSPMQISSTPKPTSPCPAKAKRPNPNRSFDVKPKKLKRETEVTLLHVLLPNATSFKLKVDAARIHSLLALRDLIRRSSLELELEPTSTTFGPPRPVDWGEAKLSTQLGQGINDDKSVNRLMIDAQNCSTTRILVEDGHKRSLHIDPNLWDVTPKPEFLRSLPQGYKLETALADQIDNAIQAVWHNPEEWGRLVRVNLSSDEITIFDSGQGMDASSENFIENWGTVGGSRHSEEHHKALGGKPPFLNPYFGKYGAGAISGSLFLGGRVTVSSKTRKSNMVTTLVLETEELVNSHKREPQRRVWKAPGEFRLMTKTEHKMAPHGTFTKVVITKLREQYCLAEGQYWSLETIRQILKDIYSPYIQSERESRDGASSETIRPVNFEVNGVNLTEVTECETALLHKHTATGELKPLVLDIHLTQELDGDEQKKVGGKPTNSRKVKESKARITCFYYPNLKGKESLEAAAEEINRLNHSSSMTFENMNRVTIRWLGRLLPDVKWMVFPFMEVASKKEHKSGLRLWGRRVRAFVDTDAGFYPVSTKTELDRGQPFVAALQHIGLRSIDKTPAAGVNISIKCGNKELKPSQLEETYFKWLSDSHKEYDQEFEFLDVANYIFNREDCLKDLGVGDCLVFHKHMKDDKNDWKIDDANPLHFKLPKGPGLKADKYVTLEYFFHGHSQDDRGVQAKFLCRGIDLDASEGCQIISLEKGDLFFKLKGSQWFPATLLNTATHVKDADWKKKNEDISNKLPGFVEILKDEDTKMFDMCERFPINNSRFEAGYSLPKDFLVVVRPRKGSGPTSKQGMIVSEPMGMKLEVRHCSCPNVKACQKRLAIRGKEVSLKGVTLPQTNEDHSRVVCSLKAKSISSKDGIKGLYVFSTESTVINRLVEQGTYTFRLTVESNKYKDVRPAVSSIVIVPSTKTEKWTICNHPDRCTIDQHESTRDDQPLTIRLEEPIRENLFVQKYDHFGNTQVFQTPMKLDMVCVTLEGGNLDMHATIESTVIAGAEDGQRLLLKNILFEKGSLNEYGSTDGALLRVCLADDQKADIKCNVLPGALATVKVKAGHPPIVKESMEFLDQLRPGEVIKILTIQGLDKFGNKVDKGQKLRVVLEGVEFQDDCGNERLADEDGTVQLGGLLKVACQYNCEGSIAFYSGIKLISKIYFETSKRRLVTEQVPLEAYVGRQVEGISIQIVDEKGNVDKSVNGYNQPITADWISGVAYPFLQGECILPSITMPEKAGAWKGTVSFSPDPSLSVTLTVQLKFKTASSIHPASQDKQILNAESGLSFSLPFKVYDDQNKTALLDDSLRESIKLAVEVKNIDSDRTSSVDCNDVKTSMLDGIPTYEAQIVVSSPTGMYKMTLTDTSGTLKGKAEVLCKLQHGPIARLMVKRSDGTIVQSCGESNVASVSGIEAKRRSPFPELQVSLLDSLGNICTAFDGKTVMRLLECPDWQPHVSEISRGEGKVEYPELDVPVGLYQVSIELDTSREEEKYSITRLVPARFSLTVHHGNYPSGLRVVGPDPVRLSLTGEAIQYLPTLTVLIESADGQRLESSPTVGVSLGSDPKIYYGSRVERSDKEMESQTCLNGDQDLSSTPINLARYEFTEVCAPDQADVYTMKFVVLDSDIPPQSQILVVRHGPGKKIVILPRIAGQEVNVLEVNIVDAHGNVCEKLSGLRVSVELTLTESFIVTPDLKPSTVVSKCTTVVKEGLGDFGVLMVTQGIQGFYSLKIIPVHGEGEMILQSLMPVEVTVTVIRGKPNLDLRQLCDQLQSFQMNHGRGSRLVKSLKEVKRKEADLQSMESDIKKLEVEISRQECRKFELLKSRSHDAAILQAEINQPKRDDQSVVQDLTNLARNNITAPLLFLQGCSDKGLFSPHQLGDFVGLAAMLARVEDDSFNRVLAEYLGVGSLCLIVTRTQLGINALEGYNSFGEVDESIGLHAFAHSHGCIVSKYDALALSDITPFARHGKSAVDKHPQRLLDIEPPSLPPLNKVPDGFLGYAVNLLYLKPEHLQIRVDTKTLKDVGLRESLWFNMLRNLQVYDTRDNMIAAKERLKTFQGGAISLDGGLIKTNNRQQLGRRRNDVPICFGLVPMNERLIFGSLMPVPHLAIERQREYLTIDTFVKSSRQVLNMLIPERNTVIEQLNELKRGVKEDEKQLRESEKSSKQIAVQIAKVQRAAQRPAAKGEITENDRSPSLQSDGARMRIFMM